MASDRAGDSRAAPGRMTETMTAGSTSAAGVERLRDAIDSGRTGDKAPFTDPAAAPLGADDEAAGTPPTAER
ncbi:hypothetical protein ACIKT0_17815, partial [Hansschlegelia beijingensis]